MFIFFFFFVHILIFLLVELEAVLLYKLWLKFSFNNVINCYDLLCSQYQRMVQYRMFLFQN